MLREIPMFEKGICADFHFFEMDGKEPDRLVFCKACTIFSFDFITKKIKEIYKLQTPMTRQPLEFEPNEDQTIFMLASPEDGIHINLNMPKEDRFTNF